LSSNLVTLTVSAQNDCSYCVAAHSVVAQLAGMPAPVLEELRNQQVLSDHKLNALRSFVLSVMANRGWVPMGDIQSFLNAGYSRRHIFDVLTIIALKTLSNYVNHIAKTRSMSGSRRRNGLPPRVECHRSSWTPVKFRAAHCRMSRPRHINTDNI